MNFHTGQWGTWGKGGDPGGGSGAWDVEFGIAFEVGPRHRVVPNASDTYMSESPGSSGLERSAQSCFIYCLIFNYLAVSGLSCGTWDVCCIMQDLSLWLHHVGFPVATHRPQSAWALYLWHTGLVALWLSSPNQGDLSSPTRDRTCGPCTGRQNSSPLDHQGSPHSDVLSHGEAGTDQVHKAIFTLGATQVAK